MDDNSRIALYRQTLQTAVDEWISLQREERRITVRKNHLRQTFQALYPIAYPDDVTNPDLTNMSLANAIRLVVGSIDRPISAVEMRGKLMDLGFDLSKYDNPLANIHTAMNRMVEAEELVWANEEENKALPGTELKTVPTPLPAKTDDQLRNDVLEILSSIGVNANEGKK